MKYLIIILLFLTGCNATKQAARDEKKTLKIINKAIKLSRNTVAKVTRDSFPCITGKIIASDSTEYKSLLKTIDSINNLEPVIDKQIEYVPIYEDTIHCIDLLKTVDGLKKVIATKENKIKQLNAAFSNFKPIHDTIPVRDSTETVIAQKETATANEQIKKQDRIIDRRGNFNMYLIIALLLSLLINFIQFKRK